MYVVNAYRFIGTTIKPSTASVSRIVSETETELLSCACISNYTHLKTLITAGMFWSCWSSSEQLVHLITVV